MLTTEVLARDVVQALKLLARRTSKTADMSVRLQRMLMRCGARRHNDSNSADEGDL